LWLVCGLAGFNLFVVWLPFKFIKEKIKKERRGALTLPLIIFICIGLGFMILEISLFQKFILFLGSPTMSLSILLSSLLIGMGTGSSWGKKFYKENINKRISTVCLLIVAGGVLLFILCPYILTQFLVYSLIVRCAACFFMILPFGFLLGIPFPSCIQLLKQGSMEKYIPWMYGVNGTMSVLGSVLAVLLSMMYGFTPAFFIGLCFYLVVPALLWYTKYYSGPLKREKFFPHLF
jgi:predicted membrane-bound spermidine synthase